MSSSPSQDILQAEQLIESGKLAEAKILLIRLIKNNPRDAQAWYLLSFVVTDSAQQQDSLRRAVNLDPSNDLARSRLAALTGGPAPTPSEPESAPAAPIQESTAAEEPLQSEEEAAQPVESEQQPADAEGQAPPAEAITPLDEPETPSEQPVEPAAQDEWIPEQDLSGEETRISRRPPDMGAEPAGEAASPVPNIPAIRSSPEKPFVVETPEGTGRKRSRISNLAIILIVVILVLCLLLAGAIYVFLRYYQYMPQGFSQLWYALQIGIGSYYLI